MESDAWEGGRRDGGREAGIRYLRAIRSEARYLLSLTHSPNGEGFNVQKKREVNCEIPKKGRMAGRDRETMLTVRKATQSELQWGLGIRVGEQERWGLLCLETTPTARNTTQPMLSGNDATQYMLREMHGIWWRNGVWEINFVFIFIIIFITNKINLSNISLINYIFFKKN